MGKSDRIVRRAIFFLLFIALQLCAMNQLIVRRPTTGAFRVGYINEAVLVVEPQGSHAEQSLYLHYSDRGAMGGAQLEVLHHFELPADAVINDLWLWMDNNVMQAVMMDRWRAKAIYDSLLPKIYIDPALLIKTGRQYELHIYPLISGTYRKVKINFFTPVVWNDQQARVALPLAMLKANNASVKPLKILFRTKEDIWGIPSLEGMAGIPFQSRRDTMGFHYHYAYLPDVTPLTELVLTYKTKFDDGFYFRANQRGKEPIYFITGIDPQILFQKIEDPEGKKALVGIDLSGNYRINLFSLLENIKKVLKTIFSQKNEFKLMVAGADEIQTFPDDWVKATETEAVFSTFAQSTLANKIANLPKPHILFADESAYKTWGFEGLDQVATWEKTTHLLEAAKYFHRADIVAAYEHGYEWPISETELQTIRPRLDSLFARGGRFLTFFDSNRVRYDILTPSFISGVAIIQKSAANLHCNESGNIGRFFPQECFHSAINFLSTNDPQAKTELMNAIGQAAVISKRISKGLFVVSGIWAYKNENAVRRDLAIPLLGLNQSNPKGLLLQLLQRCQQQYQSGNYKKLIIFSNADSVFTKSDAETAAANVIAAFGQQHPSIHTINLIDFPPYYSSQMRTEYKGSGYFEYALSNASGGLHFETAKVSWDTIATRMFYVPPLKKINFDIKVDDGKGQLLELYPMASDYSSKHPYFFIGSALGDRTMQMNVTAEFTGSENVFNGQYVSSVDHDTTYFGQTTASIVGYKRLKDLLKQTPLDTAAIVALAMKFRLLCDFTALIALEPSEKYHFMRNPFDEGKMVPVHQHPQEEPADSLRLDLYPNPFNDYVTLEVSGLEGARLTLRVYNLHGQLVRTLAQEQPLVGLQRYSWDGRDDGGRGVGSGIYFVRAILQQKGSKAVVCCKRVIMLR